MGDLGVRTVNSGLGKSGVGFVIIPPNVDRSQYVEDCYRTNTVTISGGFGFSAFPSVPCPPNILQSLQFPSESGKSGTPVVWILNDVFQTPIIVGYLEYNGDKYVVGEKSYRLLRGEVGINSVEILVDGEATSLDITMLGNADYPSRMTVRLGSTNTDSVLNVFSDNEINVYSDKLITINSNDAFQVNVSDEGENKMSLIYKKKEGFHYKDEFGNEIICKDGEVDIISEKINHNNGAEPMVLGDTLKNLLNDTLTAITQLTVPTGLGPSGTPINTPSFQQLASKLSSILSKKSNLE